MSNPKELRLGRKAEHGKHIRLGNGASAETDELIQRGFRITHRALGAARNGVLGCLINSHLFLVGDEFEVFDD